MAENCSHNCSECGSNCNERTAPQSMLEKQNSRSSVKKVIGIVSGKGGVGKSLITALLASGMQKRGYRTAVLDADVTGPSVPKIFGVKGKAIAADDGIQPDVTANGTKIMSVNLLLDNDTEPVIWRGPIISGVVKQFWTDVIWGDVDYMFVDMPPGTGDVPLTVFQSLPINGIIVVTSPQELVGMIVGKAVKMAEMMKIPVLGIVENMSYFECPACHEKYSIFGESRVNELAAEYQIDTVSKLPIRSDIAHLCDSGKVEDIEVNALDVLMDKLSAN
ncbi:MAG: P-loop NTPase [Oscillospiraceae bacterium]